ncbi:hypothetical protein JW898_05835 [Candidatus Woesearchaeota archaeon]|nr:hypothetical protein [Candidatus Woesearchaeota archaeon]
MGGIDHITVRFSEIELGGSELELSLEKEVWDSVEGTPNEHVEWHVYYVRAYKAGEMTEEPARMKAEIGRTLYSRETLPPRPCYTEGDTQVIVNFLLLLAHLKGNGARATVSSDSTGLFESLGTLEGFSADNILNLCASRNRHTFTGVGMHNSYPPPLTEH